MVNKKMAIRLPDGRIAAKLTKEVVESYKLEVKNRIDRTLKIIFKMEGMGISLVGQEKELRDLLSKLEGTDLSDVDSVYSALIEIDRKLKEIENNLREAISK